MSLLQLRKPKIRVSYNKLLKFLDINLETINENLHLKILEI